MKFLSILLYMSIVITSCKNETTTHLEVSGSEKSEHGSEHGSEYGSEYNLVSGIWYTSASITKYYANNTAKRIRFFTDGSYLTLNFKWCETEYKIYEIESGLPGKHKAIVYRKDAPKNVKAILIKGSVYRMYDNDITKGKLFAIEEKGIITIDEGDYFNNEYQNDPDKLIEGNLIN